MQLLAGSGNPSVDRDRFMRACAFNFVILGTDAHAKNYSVLIEPDNYRLAPLYDINSILPYDLPTARKLAMSVGGEFRWRSITRRNWEKMAEASQYPAEDTIEHVRHIIERAPDEAQDIRRKCRAAGLTTPVLTRLAAGIAARCKSLKQDF
jgi:serine/threonine-protein kinase HipA